MNELATFDVCLIYEQHGELQSDHIKPWVDNLIRSMPMTNFAVITIHTGKQRSGCALEKPANFSQYHCFNIDICKAWQPPPKSQRKQHGSVLPAAPELLKSLYTGDGVQIVESLVKLQHQLEITSTDAHHDFLCSEENWQMLRESYIENANGSPFLEFFQLARSLLSPLYAFSELVENVPIAKCYHSLTHGYSGYLGTILQHRFDSRLISSSHGDQYITNRMRIELENSRSADAHSLSHTELWLRLRESMKRVTNKHANAITTTSQHQFNLRKHELDKDKVVHLIPEGVDTKHFFHLFSQHLDGPPLVVATIGTVEPERDTKGFIRSIANLRERLPGVIAWVVGSLETDQQYAKECKSLVRNLGLYNHVRFFGDQDESTIYPRIGILVVNTLADTPPITLQQAQAAGVPVVATDVGACRELVEGRDERDKQLGSSGAVVPIADPIATAKAIAALLEDPRSWANARTAGIERSRRYHQLDSMLKQYRNLYQFSLRAA